MDARLERELVYARALRARGAPALRELRPSPEIAQSWARCIDAGLDMGRPPRMHVVGDAQLQRRREQSERVRRLAIAELETLFHQIAGSNFLLAFADQDGVILDLYADSRFASSSSGEGIVVGSHWSERVAGTNGLGTALATGRSVAVNGPEHFFTRFGNISCTATPVRDAAGSIVGVLDASSYFESRQRHTQALVQMAASHIEKQLFLQERDGEVLLAIHPRAEFLTTLSAGLLAFDAAGRLGAFNARAEALLAGVGMAPGTPFERLFGEPFERVIARLQRHDAVALHDAFGSALVVSWINRRARARRIPGPAPAAALAHRPGDTALPVLAVEDVGWQHATELLRAAVRQRVTVLLRGETGTGKAMLARQAHAMSGRAGAFVTVHCAELPEERCEAALFGYVAGAFDGAHPDGHRGLIASAEGGTLLLDEVSRLPLAAQAALLRFLDDGCVRPLGSTTARPLDVQVMAATNTDLEAHVAAGRVRADLLFRLNMVCVDLPPLRRRSDFAACVQATLHSIDTHATLSRAASERLAAHAWPGNFRELRAVLLRALLLHPTRCLDTGDIEPLLPRPAPVASDSTLRRHVRESVREEFRRCGNVSQTARALGISRTTVYRHLRGPAAPRD